jgi:hypothetical protein
MGPGRFIRSWSRRMADSLVRKARVVGRRQGRRSLAAYGSQARAQTTRGRLLKDGSGGRLARAVRDHGPSHALVASFEGCPDSSAAAALAVLFPLTRRLRRLFGAGARGAIRAQSSQGGIGNTAPQSCGSEGASMKRKPSIRSLDTVSLDEAMAYLDHANGDELAAAHSLAWDRNRLDGSNAAPDDAEVHHALFLLCRTRGKRAPSFDEMRVELRRRQAA